MRSVLELRRNPDQQNHRDLWVLKANFLGDHNKKKSFILSYDASLIFENTESRGTGAKAKTRDPETVEVVIDLFKKGFKDRDIAEKLKKTQYKLSKSSVNKITKNIRSKQ